MKTTVDLPVQLVRHKRFVGVEVLKKAVDREIKRKKAMAQYMVVFRDGQVKKIQFSSFQ